VFKIGTHKYVTKRANDKLLNAYAHISKDDDEYVVPGYTIAESSIFVDFVPLEDRFQTRSKFNVISCGEGVARQLKEVQERYKGKVRLSITHCHQFGGMSTLSGTDIGGFQNILSNPNASKPYADGSQMPVLLISDSGSTRKVIGFLVTASEVSRARVQLISDDSERVLKAWKSAPVAMPDLPKPDIMDTIRSEIGYDWEVRLAQRRSVRDGWAILLEHKSGVNFVVEIGGTWPKGPPRIIRRPSAKEEPINYANILDVQALLNDIHETTFTMRIPENRLPSIVNNRGEILDEEIAFIQYIDWFALAKRLIDCIDEIPKDCYKNDFSTLKFWSGVIGQAFLSKAEGEIKEYHPTDIEEISGHENRMREQPEGTSKKAK